jgi:hypothetical protein
MFNCGVAYTTTSHTYPSAPHLRAHGFSWLLQAKMSMKARESHLEARLRPWLTRSGRRSHHLIWGARCGLLGCWHVKMSVTCFPTAALQVLRRRLTSCLGKSSSTARSFQRTSKTTSSSSCWSFFTLLSSNFIEL